MKALALTVKDDLERGFPTFAVVTSLRRLPPDAMRGLKLYPVPLYPLWDEEAMKSVVMKAIDANTLIDAVHKLNAKHAAAVSIDISGGNPKRWRHIERHFGSQRIEDISVQFGEAAKGPSLWALFYLSAHCIVTGTPYTTADAPDDIAESMVDEGVVNAVSIGNHLTLYSAIPSAWLYSNETWTLLLACAELRKSLYSSDITTLEQGWKRGILAVMYLRARAWGAVNAHTRRLVPFTHYKGEMDTKTPIPLDKIFGAAQFQDDDDHLNTLFYPWDNESLAAYTVNPRVLREAFTVNVVGAATVSPRGSGGSFSEPTAEARGAHVMIPMKDSGSSRAPMFEYITTPDIRPPSVEAISSRFCQKDKKQIVLLFQHVRSATSETVHLEKMRSYAEAELGLTPGKYLNVVFVADTPKWKCEDLAARRHCLEKLQPIKGAIVVRSDGLIRMLEAFGSTTLVDGKVGVAKSRAKRLRDKGDLDRIDSPSQRASQPSELRRNVWDN